MGMPTPRPASPLLKLGQHRVPRPFGVFAILLSLCAGAVAHPPDAEFADWFSSLKEPGTEGATGGAVSCCSPASDCQITDYESDGEGRYWITTEGERIQVPRRLLAPLQRASCRTLLCQSLRGLEKSPLHDHSVGPFSCRKQQPSSQALCAGQRRPTAALICGCCECQRRETTPRQDRATATKERSPSGRPVR